MKKNIEIETRAMLTKEQYFLICAYYLRHNQYLPFIENVNSYFDDENLSLTNEHKMIRVRTINNYKYELTLKIKGIDSDIEINQPIDNITADEIINKSIFPTGVVLDEAIKRGIDISSLKNIASVYTRRLSVTKTGYRIDIDLNRYNGVEDYNIEIETTKDMAFAREIMKKISDRFGFEVQDNYLVKSARAILSLKK